MPSSGLPCALRQRSYPLSEDSRRRRTTPGSTRAIRLHHWRCQAACCFKVRRFFCVTLQVNEVQKLRGSSRVAAGTMMFFQGDLIDSAKLSMTVGRVTPIASPHHVDTSKPAGGHERCKIFVDADAAQAWFAAPPLRGMRIPAGNENELVRQRGPARLPQRPSAATSLRPASAFQNRDRQKPRSSCTGRRRHRTAKRSLAFPHGPDQSPPCMPGHPPSKKWVASEPKQRRRWKGSQQRSESCACSLLQVRKIG